MHGRNKVHDIVLKYPVLYAFNYPLTYYSAYGYKPIQRVMQALNNETCK